MTLDELAKTLEMESAEVVKGIVDIRYRLESEEAKRIVSKLWLSSDYLTGLAFMMEDLRNSERAVEYLSITGFGNKVDISEFTVAVAFNEALNIHGRISFEQVYFGFKEKYGDKLPKDFSQEDLIRFIGGAYNRETEDYGDTAKAIGYGPSVMHVMMRKVITDPVQMHAWDLTHQFMMNHVSLSSAANYALRKYELIKSNESKKSSP